MRTAGPLGFRTQSFSAPRTSPRPAEAFCYIFAALRYVFRLKVTGGFFRLGLAWCFSAVGIRAHQLRTVQLEQISTKNFK